MTYGIQSQIVLYQPDETISIEVKLDAEHDTVWLSTTQIAQLFIKEESNIRRHIGNIFSEGELERENNVHFLHVNGVKKPVPFYNLDVIISVGYRVHSHQGIIVMSHLLPLREVGRVFYGFKSQSSRIKSTSTY